VSGEEHLILAIVSCKESFRREAVAAERQPRGRVIDQGGRVVSFAVGLRTHEIGIRLALGAEGGSVVRMILPQGLRIVLAGLLIGLAGALAIGPVLAHLTYRTGGRDPIALLAAAAAQLTVGLLACYFPARRAADLDPATALRS